MNKKNKNDILYPQCENGMYMYEYVEIGGIKQYIQIRGKDRSNPILLFVHGGPGGSMAGYAHIMQDLWEEHFTVVNWDQRNACKTYLANKDRAMEIAKTGTMEDYIGDIDEIIKYLHTIYDFEKIILLGFSWGSVIGSEYARKHPENVSCYIGVGQLINYVEGFHVVGKQVLERAKKQRNKKDIEKINKVFESIPDGNAMTDEFMKQIMIFSRIANKYLSENSRGLTWKEFLTSPLMDGKARKAMYTHHSLLTGTFKTLFEYDFRDDLNFPVPMYFITGEEDTSCPHSMLKEIVDDISAPKKELHIMKKAGHCCFFDRKEEFNELLKSITVC
ncbi:MAG: alpha/beta hydrolase [Lachnospiraceae bacterium]|nr:alpha/beta hydrolase [Lachnospiraceae bacterium]